MPVRSLAATPRLPSCTRSASRSATSRHSTSVVVVTPARDSTSARLRYVRPDKTSFSASRARPMSSTIPFASRASRANAASTTYVAPWSACAGPNTSPGRLWAIIMWSLTVTSNMSALPRSFVVAVGDRVAEGRGGPGRDLAHHLGELLERRLPGEQDVKDRVSQQSQRQRHPVCVRTPAPPRRGDLAHL